MTAPQLIAVIIAGGLLILVVMAYGQFRRANREFERVAARRNAVWTRIEADLEQSRSGVRHGTPFTLNPTNPPRGKATHVSSTGERSENRG